MYSPDLWRMYPLAFIAVVVSFWILRGVLNITEPCTEILVSSKRNHSNFFVKDNNLTLKVKKQMKHLQTKSKWQWISRTKLPWEKQSAALPIISSKLSLLIHHLTFQLFPPKMTAFTFNDASAVGSNNIRLKCQKHKLQRLLKKSFLNKVSHSTERSDPVLQLTV